ncbi:MAG: hypothetical protein GXO90_09995 [FCB group bacterium]|nr:hypothetical protein [FCB group bacterium]
MLRKSSSIVKMGWAAASLITLQCSQPSSAELAVINSVPITTDRFTDHYSQFLSFASQPDNLLNRIQYLQAMIDEELLVQTAQKNHWDQTPDWQEEFGRIRDQLLLNTIYERDLVPDLKVNEAELRTLYRWSKQTLHVRHLFSRTRAGIDSLAAQLQSGVPWEQLAKTSFRDPQLAGSGGDLGWVSLGDLDPPFEQAAFPLTDGEISAPVQTSTGWSLIQVQERTTDPFLVEAEFQWRRKRFERIGKSYRKAPVVRAYTDRVADDLDLSFDSTGLQQVLETIHSGGDAFEKALPNADSPCIYQGRQNKTYTVEDALGFLRTLSERQLKKASSPENLRAILTGLLVRLELLKRGHSEKLDREPSFQQALRQARRNIMVRKAFSRITKAVTSPDPDSLVVLRRNRYLAFRDSLRKESRIDIDRQRLKTLFLPLN